MAAFVVDDSTQQRESALSLVPPSLILSRLRTETRGEHEAVEQVLDLMNTALDRDGYCHRLVQFYGFYAALEPALKECGEGLALKIGKAHHAGQSHTSLDTHAALASRLNKTQLLTDDLDYLGHVTKNISHCRDLPPLETQAELLGCLYVMEGATLGGRMITQHVRTTLGITPATGGSFFNGYGDNTGKMWQGMRQLLLDSAVDSKTENTIVASAIATFASLRRWCQSCQQQQTLIETAHNARKH